jgi:hypothetical protein
MGLQATSRVRFRTSSGEIHIEPQEWTPYTVLVDLPGHLWRSVQLSIQGITQPVFLRVFDNTECVCAEWPRSNAGRYRLQIQSPLCDVEQLITVWPGKLSTQAFERLLDDLHQSLAVECALSLQKTGGLAGFDLPEPGQQTLEGEVARIRRALFGTNTRLGIIKVLAGLADDPHSSLRSTQHWTQRWRSRRPDPGALASAMARPHNIAPDNSPYQIVDHSVDTYENQILKLFVRQVEQRLRFLERVAVSRPASSRTISSLQFRLKAAVRRASFLLSVSLPKHDPTNVTMVLTKRPEYRAMFEGFLDFRRSPLVRFEHPDLDSPLDGLPRLYQSWGVVSVINILLHVAGESGFRQRFQNLVHRDAAGLYVRVLPGGTPVLELEHRKTASRIVARAEPSYRRKHGRFRSISYVQRPDLVIEIHRSGRHPRLLVFDPKYNVHAGDTTDSELDPALRPIKGDVDKMHTYRDSIRDECGRRVVEYAATLYPGPSQYFGDSLAALGAIPGDVAQLSHELRSIFRDNISGFLRD